MICQDESAYVSLDDSETDIMKPIENSLTNCDNRVVVIFIANSYNHHFIFFNGK
jgi:hypothetical protein